MANVFISYARQDEHVAARLSRILRAAGQNVINDQGSLVTGSNFSKEIVEELTNAQVVVVLLSRNSIRDKWVEEELRAGFEKDHQVIPVLLDEDAKNNDMASYI